MTRPTNRLALLFLAAGLAFAQDYETTTSTSTSFSRTVRTNPGDRRVVKYATRVVAGTNSAPPVYDMTLSLPPDADEVQAAIAKASADLRAVPTVKTVSSPRRINHGSTTTSEVVRTPTNVVRTIGVTQRQTIGPATIRVGALSTEASPCSGYTGGTPLGFGGLTPGDGFQFHFTSPVMPSCSSGTRLNVPEGTKNFDTLTHIHSQVEETAVTTRTETIATTYEIIGTLQGEPAGPSEPTPTFEDAGILVRYVTNLDLGDATIQLTNSGARGAGLPAGVSASTTGAICVNVYAFSPDDQLVSCCNCAVTPNGLMTLSARQDFLSASLMPSVPTALLIKLYPSAPVGASCSSSASNPGPLSPGLHAWGTTIQRAGPSITDFTETPFLRTSSTTGERDSLASRCAILNASGSGFGICRSCRLNRPGGGRLNVTQ